MRECQILKQEHKVACVKEEQPLTVLRNILNTKLMILHKGRGGKKEQGGVCCFYF